MFNTTGEKILDAALRLFERDGYDATTMRAIAAEAGVSTGNAYYWFSSKDDLVQAFYVRLQQQHATAAAEALAHGGSLVERLRAVEDAGLTVMARYHSFGAAFLSTAIRPGSAASPFSPESAAAREESLAIYREVVAGAQPAVPKKLAPVLPEFLWLAHLLITLFWATDSSADQRRTRDLVERSVTLLGGIATLARLPGSGAVIDQLRGVLDVAVPR